MERVSTDSMPTTVIKYSIFRTLLLLYKQFDFTVDEGKEWLNPSRDKNQGTRRRRKVD